MNKGHTDDWNKIWDPSKLAQFNMLHLPTTLYSKNYWFTTENRNVTNDLDLQMNTWKHFPHLHTNNTQKSVDV